jgi:integrase
MGTLDIIRSIFADGSMPRQRFQDPTIQQSKNGSYFIRPWVDVIGGDGSLRREKKTIVLGDATLGARGAKAKKSKVMEVVNRADYVIHSQVVFRDFIEGDYTLRHLRKLSASTREKYRNHLKNHILPAFGSLKLCEMTALRIDDWMQSKVKCGLAHATRLDLRNILSSIFTQAENWDLWKERNPVQGLDCGEKKAARQKKKLSDDDTRRLLAALPYDLRVMCCTGLFCTLRVSEMLGLQEKHLDFDRNMILVQQRYYRGNLDTTKNAKHRDIPMGYLVEDLKRLIMGDPDRYVFQIKTRPRWGRQESLCRDDRDLNQHFLRPAAMELGFYTKGFGFHSLRREAITSIGSVLGIGQAMSVAGQSKVDMTLLYTLQDFGEQERAIKSHQERIMGIPKGDLQ